MSERIEGKRVAFLVANEGVEQVELTQPLGGGRGGRRRAGADRPGGGRGAGVQPPRQGRHVRRRPHAVADADADDYDALVLPGGVANPDILRTDAGGGRVRARASSRPASRWRRSATRPWTLVEAGVVEGRTLTSWPSLQTDIRNAGGEWVDEEVHVDSGLVTSRKPDDLEAFCAKAIEEIAEGVHDEQREATVGS